MLSPGGASQIKSAETQIHLAPVECRRVVVIGQLGAGKSTVLNALLGCHLLPTSAIGMACTATTVEIHHEKREGLRAVVKFMSKQNWSSLVLKLLADVESGQYKSGHDRRAESAAAYRSLLEVYYNELPSLGLLTHMTQVYPQHESLLQSKDALAHVNIFLEDPRVSLRLDMEETFTAANSDELYNQLETFVRSDWDEDEDNALWALVDRVQVFGPFEVLASGTTLVDAPGYGSGNIFREIHAKRAVGSADKIMLVYDVRRAIYDLTQTMREYIKERTETMTDIRTRDIGIFVVVTGNDLRMLYSQAKLDQKQRSVVSGWEKELENLEMIRQVLEKEIASGKQEQASHDHLERRFKDIKVAISILMVQKARFYAENRATKVREGIQDLYKRCFIDISRGIDPSALPVFVVGCRDYFCMKGMEDDKPTVSTTLEDTGIPGLSDFLSRNGD
ncbi:hypothetical protein HYDPIDRAFT_120470 [Hydnomerulius pinastri MD-312]|uniref:Dynamin N-terminal domain-containing protein n=1 Tax=Hydnomerulius pinastri MD-312 TaxID=994086 RepID=A0A0C9W6F5_9AGAM|nr:hypothetical protein HYDPIDRAFT_120470 [Hydnomerulius pinastri MD-312]